MKALKDEMHMLKKNSVNPEMLRKNVEDIKCYNEVSEVMQE